MGGSLELPEVRAAADAASRHFVQLDELMEAAGKRLAELTQAEWGIVTAGCTAAVTHATAACIAGGNPDRHVRLPNLEGFPKDEVVIPKHSRNNYDSAVRATGARFIEVHNAAEMEAAIGPRTAMVYVFTGPRSEVEPPSFDDIARIAKVKNVPVVVDAAAEFLTIPNQHLQRGATMVCYSGGKCIRGPQCAGLLLGRKDLVQAAWIHSAPHHGFARGMKVGKEEIVGMLMAVEMWARRDHAAEQRLWQSWMEYIAKRVSSVEGVTAEIRKPTTIANTPGLSIRWSTTKIGITGQEVAKVLFSSEPRIAVSGGRGAARGAETGISLEAYMMAPGEEKVVADRIHAVLSNERQSQAMAQPKPPVTDLSGEWLVSVTYRASAGEQTLVLKQQGNRLAGTHRGEFLARELTGTIDGDSVSIRSSVDETVIGNSLSFTFTGRVSGDTMSGDLDMGEYLSARWSARRYQYRQAG
jgi:L-seryl-tRNA(Ser) seleniumtransferase